MKHIMMHPSAAVCPTSHNRARTHSQWTLRTITQAGATQLRYELTRPTHLSRRARIPATPTSQCLALPPPPSHALGSQPQSTPRAAEP